MKSAICSIFVATLFAGTVHASAASHGKHGDDYNSKILVVESPSDLPSLAQADGEAIYLHNTDDGRAILYVEAIGGKDLSILDVTHPADIRSVGRVKLSTAGSFDFVQKLNDSAVLIRFRNQSGFASLKLQKAAQSAIIPAPALALAHNTESIGDNGLLLTSTSTMREASAPTPTDYQVMDTSNPSRPVLLTTIAGVKQRLSSRYTGTLFFLSSTGITVVRQPRVEQAYASAMSES